MENKILKCFSEIFNEINILMNQFEEELKENKNNDNRKEALKIKMAQIHQIKIKLKEQLDELLIDC